jgi:hypothetical protein
VRGSSKHAGLSQPIEGTESQRPLASRSERVEPRRAAPLLRGYEGASGRPLLDEHAILSDHVKFITGMEPLTWREVFALNKGQDYR